MQYVGLGRWRNDVLVAGDHESWHVDRGQEARGIRPIAIIRSRLARASAVSAPARVFESTRPRTRDGNSRRNASATYPPIETPQTVALSISRCVASAAMSRA